MEQQEHPIKLCLCHADEQTRQNIHTFSFSGGFLPALENRILCR